MKYKTTKKQLKNNYNNIIQIGYCNAYYLLKYKKPESYCSGVYGWSCDNYDIGGVLISTGYNPINGKKYDYNTIKLYEKKAEDIVKNLDIDHDTKKIMIDKLLKKAIDTILETWGY